MNTIPVLIRVTADDIKHGKCVQPRACAIARAVQRRLRHRYCVSAHHVGINIFIEYSIHVGQIETPDVAREFMANYDLGDRPVKPFDFKIRVPLALYYQAFKAN